MGLFQKNGWIKSILRIRRGRLAAWREFHRGILAREGGWSMEVGTACRDRPRVATGPCRRLQEFGDPQFFDPWSCSIARYSFCSYLILVTQFGCWLLELEFLKGSPISTPSVCFPAFASSSNHSWRSCQSLAFSLVFCQSFFSLCSLHQPSLTSVQLFNEFHEELCCLNDLL